jgi:hypothetical protein
MSDEHTYVSSQDVPQYLFTLRQLADLGYGSVEHLRRRIKAGDLPARLVGGRYLLYCAEVEGGPVPSMSAGDLKEWARRMAESAPPLSPDQVGIVIAVFASSLRDASVERTHPEGADGSVENAPVLPDAAGAATVRLHAAALEVVAPALTMSADHESLHESSQLFTLRQLADMGRGSAERLRRQIKAGHLPARMVSRRYWLYVEEVDALGRRKEAQLEEAAKRVVATAPPFSPEQRDFLLALFGVTRRGERDE